MYLDKNRNSTSQKIQPIFSCLNQTKQSKMSAAVEDVLKSTQKSLSKICEKDVLKR